MSYRFKPHSNSMMERPRRRDTPRQGPWNLSVSGWGGGVSDSFLSSMRHKLVCVIRTSPSYMGDSCNPQR